MDPRDLEALIDRSLARLPEPQAPPSLLPAVMRAVSRRNARPWQLWPRPLQAAAGAAALLLAWLPTQALGRWDWAGTPLLQAAEFFWLFFFAPNAVYLAAAAGVTGAVSLLVCAALSSLLREGSPE